EVYIQTSYTKRLEDLLAAFKPLKSLLVGQIVLSRVLRHTHHFFASAASRWRPCIRRRHIEASSDWCFLVTLPQPVDVACVLCLRHRSYLVQLFQTVEQNAFRFKLNQVLLAFGTLILQLQRIHLIVEIRGLACLIRELCANSR